MSRQIKETMTAQTDGANWRDHLIESPAQRKDLLENTHLIAVLGIKPDAEHGDAMRVLQQVFYLRRRFDQVISPVRAVSLCGHGLFDLPAHFTFDNSPDWEAHHAG